MFDAKTKIPETIDKGATRAAARIKLADAARAARLGAIMPPVAGTADPAVAVLKNHNVRLLSRAEVMDLVGASYPTIWKWMREGTFPRSVEVGGKVAWLSTEIAEWMANLPRRRLKGDDKARPAQQEAAAGGA